MEINTVTKEKLTDWVAQLDNGDGCDATDKQLEDVIRQLLATMDREPLHKAASKKITDAIQKMESEGDLVLVPRGLCGAAIGAIRHPHHAAGVTLGALRHYAHSSVEPASNSCAIADVIAERHRQQSVKGFSAEQDDTYTGCELAGAAISYITPFEAMTYWPADWHDDSFKPTNERRNW